jgi:glycosyltransferase involved in cell wall biosynthesis
VMGPQDGVDLAVRAAAHIVHDLGRDDVSFTFMGGGDCWPDLMALRDELGLSEYVELPGRVPDEFVFDVMSTADLGLSPDPRNPLNDLSTMNKTLEYMAFGLPVVAFDLKETRVSAADAAVYVPDGDLASYARAIVDLLDAPERRAIMSRTGLTRIQQALAWSHQRSAYVSVFDNLVGRPAEPMRSPGDPAESPSEPLARVELPAAFEPTGRLIDLTSASREVGSLSLLEQETRTAHSV